eukprot:Hpha_TRINITY_DN15308_c0_g3::TRINITY_DN15308_c0_g3_i1::g.87602::m.87602
MAADGPSPRVRSPTGIRVPVRASRFRDPRRLALKAELRSVRRQLRAAKCLLGRGSAPVLSEEPELRAGPPPGSIASSVEERLGSCSSSACMSPALATSFGSVGPTTASEIGSESLQRRRTDLWIDPHAEEREGLEQWQESTLPSYVKRGEEHARSIADLVFNQHVEITRRDRRRDVTPLVDVKCPPVPCWPAPGPTDGFQWGGDDDEEEELTNEFEATSAPCGRFF